MQKSVLFLCIFLFIILKLSSISNDQRFPCMSFKRNVRYNGRLYIPHVYKSKKDDISIKVNSKIRYVLVTIYKKNQI